MRTPVILRYNGRVSDELQTLRRAFAAYLNARTPAHRAVMERLIDDLERMIRQGHTFGDPPLLRDYPLNGL